ncbi:MAG: hypothetical protein KJO33_11615 [Gammaproteobacteria bacterium]|nr:hypothetical protein [Gammaproteobacteria bacterium]NNK33097.1 hypothetical protein [Xanthomonadales bacterium]
MRHRFVLFGLLFASLLLAAPLVAGSGLDGWRYEATTLYESGDYAAAYKKFLKLGKKGDAYSSYRVSYMLLNGQGTEADVIESLAWAAVAAQGGSEPLRSYQDAVAAMVPEKKRKKAQSKADYYVRRWGEKEEDKGRRMRGDCTGSRLSANCKQESSSSTWIRWTKNPPDEQELMLRIEKLDEAIVQQFSDGVSDASGG